MITDNLKGLSYFLLNVAVSELPVLQCILWIVFFSFFPPSQQLLVLLLLQQPQLKHTWLQLGLKKPFSSPSPSVWTHLVISQTNSLKLMSPLPSTSITLTKSFSSSSVGVHPNVLITFAFSNHSRGQLVLLQPVQAPQNLLSHRRPWESQFFVLVNWQMWNHLKNTNPWQKKWCVCPLIKLHKHDWKLFRPPVKKGEYLPELMKLRCWQFLCNLSDEENILNPGCKGWQSMYCSF